MPQPELNSDAVDNRKQRRRGKTKGRIVDLNALLDVQNLLGDAPRQRVLEVVHAQAQGLEVRVMEVELGEFFYIIKTGHYFTKGPRKKILNSEF